MRPRFLSPEELAALSEPVFERGGLIFFEARGGSMRPFIRSGDLLTIEPADGHALQVGEVGLFRLEDGRLAAHRLVGRRESGGDLALCFRGDANLGEPEIVAPERVLGRVVVRERDGRKVWLASDGARREARLWQLVAPLGARALQLGDGLRRGAARVVLTAQGTPAYRRLGRRVLAGRVRYRLGTAADAEAWNRFHRVRGVGAASQETRAAADPFWTAEQGFAVLALAAGRLLGVADVMRYPDQAALYPGWWLSGMRVGPLYRGLGLGAGILGEVLGELGRRGAAHLYLKVFAEDARAVAFYRKLGFTAAPPALCEAHAAAGLSDPGRRPTLILSRPVDP